MIQCFSNVPIPRQQDTVGFQLFRKLLLHQLLPKGPLSLSSRLLVGADKSFNVPLTILDVLLPVEEPVGDLVLPGVLHDGDDLVHLLLAQLTGTLGQGDVGLLQDKVGVPAANTKR